MVKLFVVVSLVLEKRSLLIVSIELASNKQTHTHREIQYTHSDTIVNDGMLSNNAHIFSVGSIRVTNALILGRWKCNRMRCDGDNTIECAIDMRKKHKPTEKQRGTSEREGNREKKTD